MAGRLIKIRGVNYFVSITGSGHPVLLLHGFTGSHKIWRDLIKHSPQGYQFIMPDLLGHGETDCPAEAKRYTTKETVLDLASMLDTLQITKCSCLGYSMGGRIALSFALAMPHRILGLILESASPGLATEAERLARVERDSKLADRIETIGTHAFASEWAKIPLFATQQRLDDSLLREQQQIRCAHVAAGLANSLRGIGTGRQPSNWDKLQNLNVPTVLITGTLDKKFTDIAYEMMKGLPEGNHAQVADAGHTVHLEQPRPFRQLVYSFLEMGQAH